MSKGQQMPLILPHDEALGRDDFLAGPSNEAALTLIDRWPDWPSRWILLAGPVGAGKSHLARIWQEASHARIVTLDEVNKSDPTQLVRSGAVVVEDADGPERQDTALFHLLNAAREADAFVLMTARAWPDAWGVALPDLASRLRLTTLIELHEPDDDLLKVVLVKLFADRQLVVETSVIDFIVLRMERSIAAALRLVDAMDREAMARQKSITRPLAARILGQLEEGLL
ncbi:MAG: DnaA/Hda family protein [Cohaesibacter sp.]|jgi:chromosomal replication initiation ATPase DnaA|nr:DnaA/Hda family protein [Cohaesibacter sp.]